MASPPKPWERAGAAPVTSSGPVPTSPTASSASASTAPTLPQRPATLAANVNQNAAAYSTGAVPGYGYPGAGAPAPAYGTAYTNPYGSMYNRMGGYGAYGGGYGGGMYGAGYGGIYGAGGMYGGGGMVGMPGSNPNDPNSLTNRFNQSTATTFQMLEGIVGAFGGFAQMLESTYMATHSSFYAMISVAEQFSNLRETLGLLLGIFTLLRWLRTAVAKLTGRPLPADAKALTPASFAQFEGRPAPPGTRPRASRKPLLFFLLAAFGLPYVISKIMRSFASQEEERQRLAQGANSTAPNPAALEFCRAIYDFAPETMHLGQDLAVRKGDLVAVLSKADPFGNPIDWWQCRTRDGRVGYLPSLFLEAIKRNLPTSRPMAAIKDTASESSRASSLTSTAEVESVSVPDKEPMPVPVGKIGNVIDSFHKSQFYS